MSILIKGMGMPESCEDCSAQIIDPTGGASGCAVNHSIILRKRGERRPAECPLVDFPLERGEKIVKVQKKINSTVSWSITIVGTWEE